MECFGVDNLVIPGGDNVWNDEAYGFDGNDTIMAVSEYLDPGGAGDDIISGGVDEDRISGGAGSDQLIGGDGDDGNIALMVPLALTQSVTQVDTIPSSLKQAQAVATGEHSIVMALT